MNYGLIPASVCETLICLNFSFGVRYPSLLRGLLFRLFSIHLIRLLVTSLKSVPFGIYCLIRPLVFSLAPRSQRVVWLTKIEINI